MRWSIYFVFLNLYSLVLILPNYLNVRLNIDNPSIETNSALDLLSSSYSMILFHRIYIEYKANLNLHDHSAKSKFRKT